MTQLTPGIDFGPARTFSSTNNQASQARQGLAGLGEAKWHLARQKIASGALFWVAECHWFVSITGSGGIRRLPTKHT
jgi:hypothetical protein